MGKYADEVNRKNSNLSNLQIRANKCTRSKARNEARKVERRKEAEARNSAWAKLSVKEKLSSLDRRRGNSKKQKARLLAA